MATKISRITTRFQVEETINGYKFEGTAEVYNTQKVIKSLTATITKESDQSAPNTAMTGTTGRQYMYSVQRGISEGATTAGGMYLPDGEEGEAILTAGIAFERAVEEYVKTAEL
ncbi:hypothetical protein [Bacteroides sp.]|uniref:hypothetical protein n=1 Tax=Bacteroides sp. TaxID=29523 RepID=UPI002FC82CE7